MFELLRLIFPSESFVREWLGHGLLRAKAGTILPYDDSVLRTLLTATVVVMVAMLMRRINLVQRMQQARQERRQER